MKIPLLAFVLILYASSAYGEFLDKDIEDYCAAYAQAVSKEFLQNARVKNPVEISRLSPWGGWLSNLVSPANSQFYGGYKCRFTIRYEGQAKQASVDLLITNTKDYAEHTQWKNIQLIPIKAIHDPDKQRTGYIVVKYLKGI